MADIVNLRRERKRKVRAEAERRAEENRARFGRSAMEKSRDKAESRRAERAHEAHKIELAKPKTD